MIGWRFEEALAVDTCQVVTRWWADRRPSPAAPIPDGLVEDLHAARLELDDGLQRRLWDVASVLAQPQRAAFTKKIATLDPWHVLSEMAVGPDPAVTEQGAAEDENRGELIEALKERARRRQQLQRPHFQSATRRRLRDLARGRGRLAAVLRDDDACRMLRFGAVLCYLIDIDSIEDAEPDPDEVRALLAELTEADARCAAEAVLNDPLVGSDDRGRPAALEITEFVCAVVEAVDRRIKYRLTSNISRRAARSPDWDDLPGRDIQLILDLLACHAPLKTAEAVADLIKGALARSRSH